MLIVAVIAIIVSSLVLITCAIGPLLTGMMVREQRDIDDLF
jgi:hypothetical protein